MKIAIVCPYDYKRPGGVQAHIRDCAKELTRLGHDVTVISPSPGNATPGETGHVTFGRSRKISFNKTEFDISIARGGELARLKTYLAEQDFDIIHYHTIWTPVLSLQIFRLSRTVNIATFHDTPPDNLAGNLTRMVFYLLSQILIRRLHGVIAVSPAPASHLARIPGKTINIIPPCINLKRFGGIAPDKTQVNGGTVTILFFGRLEQRKGIFVLLHAYRKLVNDGLAVRLLIAGDGPLDARVREFSSEHALESVEMLGRIDEAQKQQLYSDCDIFCSPAIHGESFGIVLVEAMASGRPVVAARNKGYQNVLAAKSDYCLAEPGDSHDLYRKLHFLVSNDALRRELGEWGRQEAMQYDCDKVIPQLLELYRNTLHFK